MCLWIAIPDPVCILKDHLTLQSKECEIEVAGKAILKEHLAYEMLAEVMDL